MPRASVGPRRREQILSAAECLLTERGWDALTFAGICQAADVSNGVLTYHFQDKNDLLFALYERITRRIRDMLFQPFLTGRGALRERIASLVAGLPSEGVTVRQYQLLTLYFISVATEDAQIAERLRGLHGESIELLAERLTHDWAAGQISRAPRQAASMIVAVLSGFGMMHRAIGLDGSPDDAVELLHGYLTTSPADNGR